MFKANDRFEILTPTGYQPFAGVQVVRKPAVCLYFHDDSEFVCATSHKLLVDGAWIEADKVQIGDIVSGKTLVDGEYLGVVDLYDPIEVAGGHAYLSDGLVSHNCEFLGGEGTLIAPSSIKNIKDTMLVDPVETKDELSIYENATPKHRYVITVDTGEGIGQDHSAFSVIDITNKPFRQVATFYDPRMKVDLYPYTVLSVAERYNNAFVFCELNGLGDQVAKTLWDMSYPNVLMTRRKQPFGQELTYLATKDTRPGVLMSQGVKKVGCGNLKSLIENRNLIVQDEDTHRELTNFVKTGTSFKAQEGEHDDLVMSLVLFGWLVKQPGFDYLSEHHVEPNQERIVASMPFPVYLNGLNQTMTEVNAFGDKDVWTRVDHGGWPRRFG